jgi:hypothetical protein
MGREIGGQKRYYKYNECKKGDVLVNNGRFIRSFQGKFGIQWEYMDDDGIVTVLNSAGQLNWKMETYVQPGDQVKVVYDGMSLLTKGPMAGKDAHGFKVSDMGEESEPALDSSNGDAEDDDYDL